MKTFTCFLTVIVVVQNSHAWFFSGSTNTEPAAWDGLRAGFGVNPFSSTTFAALPRTRQEAVENGWMLNTSAGGCGVYQTPFYGNRYIKNNDTSVMLLFDKKGTIAGIQAGIPKDKTKTYPEPQHDKYGVFTEEANMWVITAYFVEPNTICTSGRTAQQLEREGTGTLLAVQTGPTPSSLMRMPLTESDVTTTTKYVHGKCFYGMGMHYWYDVTTDMSCDDTFPVFLMYNEGKLTAFGWAFNIYYDNSYRWEHPDRSVFSNFIDNVPDCLGVDHTVTTLHLYLTDDPWYNRC
jgi:charged multivesicular body protein 7